MWKGNEMEFALDELDTVARSEEGVACPIRRLDNGQPLLDRNGHAVSIRVLGPDSKRYRKLVRESVRKRVADAATKTPGVPAITDEEASEHADAEGLEILVACTVGWSGIYHRDGNPVVFSADAVRELYRGFPAIRDQVDAFMGSRANFTRKPSNL
jgi:hypothetical protein